MNRLLGNIPVLVLYMVLLSCLCSCRKGASNIKITGTKGYVEEIIDGNTIRLTNGLVVKLVGITPSVTAEKYLERHLLDEYVTLISDSNDPIQSYKNGSTGPINAYVVVEGDDALNSVNGRMVRTRFASKDESIEIDSLFDGDGPNLTKLNDDELLAILKASTFAVATKDGLGTGFYISSKGIALTNAHVLNNSNAESARIYAFTDNGLYDGNNYRTISRVIAYGDASEVPMDFTIFQVNLDGGRTNYLPLSASKENDGKKVAKLGCTLGSPAHFGTGSLSHTVGGVIQHSININHGDSGSPLVNEYGQVIGVNRGGLADPSGGSATSVNFAVDIQHIKAWLDEHPDIDEGVLYGK